MTMPSLKLDQNANAVQALRPVSTANIAFTGTNQQSSPFAAHIVRLIATAPCWISFGDNPVAPTGALYLAANSAEYFSVEPGEKLGVVMVSGGGDLNIAEMA